MENFLQSTLKFKGSKKCSYRPDRLTVELLEKAVETFGLPEEKIVRRSVKQFVGKYINKDLPYKKGKKGKRPEIVKSVELSYTILHKIGNRKVSKVVNCAVQQIVPLELKKALDNPPMPETETLIEWGGKFIKSSDLPRAIEIKQQVEKIKAEG